MGRCKFITIFFFLNILYLSSIGQNNQYKYIVYFTDKANSPYSLNEPSAFLTEEALERRTQQNITIKENDLPVIQTYLDNLGQLGYTVLSTSRWLNAALIQADTNDIENLLTEEPYIEKVTWASIETEGGRNELSVPFYQTNLFIQGNRQGDYGLAIDQIDMLDGQFLHNNGFQGENMLIAIMDAGFRGVDEVDAFFDLRNEGRLIATKDFVDYDNSVYESSSHGTSVLSTMAGALQNEFLGTAPKAKYILIKTEDNKSEQLVEEFNYVLGLEYADQMGVDITNASLGYTRFNHLPMDHTTDQLNGDYSIATIGADIAASKGILVINSAGNKGNTDWKYISFPSDGDSVLAVGSVDINRIRTDFSGMGLDGSSQVKPNVMALGRNAAVIRSNGEIEYASGTSFSSPIMTGLIACLWQVFPEKSNMEIINAVQESSSHYLVPDNLMGYGIPNFQAAYALLYQGKHELIDNLEEDIVVFPNPFKDQIILTLPEKIDQQLSISLMNEIGQVLFNAEIDSGIKKTIDLQIDNVSSLNKGLYFLRIEADHKIFMFKLVKV